MIARYQKLFESKKVHLNELNKILGSYGYELVQNWRDKLWYIAPTGDIDAPSLYGETLEWHIPQQTRNFDLVEILNTLARKIVDSAPFSDEYQIKAEDIIKDMINKYHIDSRYLTELNKYK